MRGVSMQEKRMEKQRQEPVAKEEYQDSKHT
jgi:hypothetical protein